MLNSTGDDVVFLSDSLEALEKQNSIKIDSITACDTINKLIFLSDIKSKRDYSRYPFRGLYTSAETDGALLPAPTFWFPRIRVRKPTGNHPFRAAY